MIIEIEYKMKNLRFRKNEGYHLHRFDGPAVIYRDGDKHSYVNNVFVGWGEPGDGRRKFLVKCSQKNLENNLKNFRDRKEGQLMREYAKMERCDDN